MIYLIGGPPKCGKTTLAKKLSQCFHIPWISADTLQNIVWAYTPSEKHSSLFPHSNLRKSKNSNDDFYSTYSAQQIVEHYIAQGKTSYDAISMIAETYVADEDSIIVEGYQVTPEIVDRIDRKFGSENIQAFFLIKKNQEQFVRDIHKSTTPNDWILRKTNDESTFTRIADMIAEYSVYFEQEAKKYGFDVFTMDEDFENTLESIEKIFSSKS